MQTTPEYTYKQFLIDVKLGVELNLNGGFICLVADRVACSHNTPEYAIKLKASVMKYIALRRVVEVGSTFAATVYRKDSSSPSRQTIVKKARIRYLQRLINLAKY